MQIQRRCPGCGEILQNQDPEKPGYTPVIKEEKTYCKRCFRLMNYNELPKVIATNDDYLKVVDHVLKQNGLMILVIDIFSFTTSFCKEIIDKLRNSDVILVVNKIDLLPKSIKVSDILEFVSKECEKHFFKVIAVHLVSAHKGYYLDELMNTIDYFRRGRNVYILGAANVGKSSFINAMLKRHTSLTTDVIASSLIPGTTLDEIVIPFFDDNKAFIDTPGLINNENVLENIDRAYYELVMPKTEVKPITYQVYGDYTFFIGGLLGLSFKNAKDVSVVFYLPEKLKLTRVKNEKLNDLINERLGKTIYPVTKNFDGSFTEELVKINKRNFIFFAGFGFAYVIGNTEVLVRRPKEMGIKVYGNILSKINK